MGNQEIPGIKGKCGLRVQNKASQRLTEFCQENALAIANTLFQKHKRRLHMDITRWLIPKSDGLYSLQPKMEMLYTGSKNRTRSWLWLRSWTLYCQIQNESEEISKTSRPFRYDLNQICYNYTVDVRNRFEGLDLIECPMNMDGGSWHCKGGRD